MKSLSCFLLIFLSFLSSCSIEEPVREVKLEIPTQPELESFAEIVPSTVVALRKSLSEFDVAKYGEPDYDAGKVLFYKGFEYPLLYLPLKRDKGENNVVRFLFLLKDQARDSYFTTIYQFDRTGYPDTGEKFSGKLSILDQNGREGITVSFIDDLVSEINISASEDNGPQALLQPCSGWNCYTSCLGSAWSGLSSFSQWACGSAAGACLWTFGANLYACNTAVFCFGAVHLACGAGCLSVITGTAQPVDPCWCGDC